MMKIKILLLFFAMVFFNFASVEAGHVSCGDTITSNTVLDSDLLDCPNNGIIIGANDIILDCNGHTILGSSSNNGNGIFMSNMQNVEVRNCKVQDFNYGASLDSPSSNGITSNTVSVNSSEVVAWITYEINLNDFLTNERIIFDPNLGQEPITLVKTEIDGTLEDELRWKGFVEDKDGNNIGKAYFVIRENGRGIAATISFGDYIYRVLSLGDESGRIAVMLIDPGLFDESIDDALLPPGLDLESAASNLDLSSGGPYYIDVLVPYSSIAEQEVGGEQNMLALISLAEMRANDAYANSQVTEMILRVVDSVRVDYNDTDIGNFLSALQNPNDGILDEIPVLRDQLGADLVAAIHRQSGSYCGYAYIMTASNMGYFDSYAYSVTRHQCITGHTFSHETGHNMGLCHDWNVGCGTTDLIYPYNYGHHLGPSGNDYRTIMAYSPGNRIPHFSNPDVLYMGYPTGVPPPQQYQAASAWGLNNIAYHVSQFREPQVNCSDTIYSDTVLDTDLLNCPNDGIIIGANDITLDCNGHTISGSNTGTGVYLSSKQNVEVRNCNLQDFSYGIYLFSSSNNILTNNTASNNSIGIYLYFSSSNTLTDNTASNNNNGIVLFYVSNNSVLTGNTASNNNYGIYFWSASGNILTGNTASNNHDGIYIQSSSGNTLTGNTASKNDYGISLVSSSNNNVLTNNEANSNNWDGIILSSSSNNNILTNDTANSNSDYGIYIFYSLNNTLTNNTASNNNHGISIYLSSNYNTLTNNTASNNNHGIYLQSSSNNTFNSNTANSNNGSGIWLLSSSNNNILTGNTANSNDDYGIWLWLSSNNNILTNNIASNNYEGIYLSSSSNNLIYNNYFNNTINAYDTGTNFWNINKTKATNIVGGPLIAGNFWSDYTGQDTNSDGIGDTNIPYNSNGNIINGGDYFPLVERKMVSRV